MPRIYKLSRTGLKLLYKIRHHRGHGIHSPFVFNLITKVIEEKTPYHAYEDIKFVLDSMHHRHYRLNKNNKLCFRLTNYFKAEKILEIGSGYGVNTLCLTASSATTECICVEVSEEKSSEAKLLYEKWNRKITLYTDDIELPTLFEKQDCIYINLSNYNFLPSELNQYLQSLSYEKTFIIVEGIRTNKQSQMLWRSIMNMESRTVTLDLFNMGILFFDTKLYRWNYKISF